MKLILFAPRALGFKGFFCTLFALGKYVVLAVLVLTLPSYLTCIILIPIKPKKDETLASSSPKSTIDKQTFTVLTDDQSLGCLTVRRASVSSPGRRASGILML